MEKLLIDDCRWEVEELSRQLEASLTPTTEADVLAAIRMVAVALDCPPPAGPQLRIYRKILGEMPKEVLVAITEKIIREYKYPSFPRPSEWSIRGDGPVALIDKARFMNKIYQARRRYAEKKYGKR